MTPLERYRADLQRAGFIADTAQKRAVKRTQRVYRDLLRQQSAPPPRWWERWLRRDPLAGQQPVKGLYLWGGVGRGKTHLLDCFYDCLPIEQKLREHFHHFMQRIHRELKVLPNTTNPLEQVAERLARDTRVICFDEFHVSDITDAMLLGNLLRALFARGVTLLATSNEAPQRLYWCGLQRERFLPAIALIQQHTEVFHLPDGADYRLRALQKAEIYHTPLDAQADASLARSFAALARGHIRAGGSIDIEGRPITARRHTDNVVWFDFAELCGGARGMVDYIEIARCYHTVLISAVPVMGEADNDAARRFVHLVDEFYDCGVKLIVSAAAAPPDLYRGERLSAMFLRTVSRLQEMQSAHYLAIAHNIK